MARIDKLDLSKIEVPKLSPNPQQPGYYSSTPLLDGKAIDIQLPLGKLAFGASPPNEAKKIKKWSLPISRDERPGFTSQPMKLAFAKFEELDRWTIQQANMDPKLFFGKPTKQSDDVCRMLMNSMIKHSKDVEKDAKYGPSISPTLKQFPTGEFAPVKCHDLHGKIVPIMEIPRHCMAEVTIRLTSIYSVNSKAFGLTWEVKTVRIVQYAQDEAPDNQPNLYGDCPDMDDAMIAATEAAEQTLKRERDDEEPMDIVPEQEVDKEEEEVEEEEEEPEPPKKKAAKKKTSAK